MQPLKISPYVLYPYLQTYHTDMIHILYGFDHGMHKPRIIAITGNNSEDKDYIAKYISRYFMYKRKDFADPIKSIATELHKFAHQHHQSQHISHRQALDFLYTNVFQKDQIKALIPQYDKHTLVQQLVQQINNNRKYVIGDLQYQHEYIALTPYNPFIIRLENKNKSTISSEEYKTIPCNIVIHYDKDYKDLCHKLKLELLSSYKN